MNLYSDNPKQRVDSLSIITCKEKRRILNTIDHKWPKYSPGSINSWLVFLGSSPGVSPGEPWNYAHEPTRGKAHPGVSEYKDARGYWDGIRQFSKATFFDLSEEDAYSMTMVRNFDSTPSPSGPKGKHMLAAGKTAYEDLNKVVKPKLVIALGSVRKYADKLFGKEEVRCGVLYTARKRRERKWTAKKGSWSTGETYLYVTISGVHPSLYHISKEDTLELMKEISNEARELAPRAGQC